MLTWKRTRPEERPPKDDWIMESELGFARVQYTVAHNDPKLRWEWSVNRHTKHIQSGYSESREAAMAMCRSVWERAFPAVPEAAWDELRDSLRRGKE